LTADGDEIVAAIRRLLRSDTTVRDVAVLLRAHTRAIEALIGQSSTNCRLWNRDPASAGFLLSIPPFC